MPNLFFHLDIDFDSNMKERTTSSRIEMQLLISDSPIRVITCKAGNKICRSLVITEAEFGKPEADSVVTFLKHDWISIFQTDKLTPKDTTTLLAKTRLTEKLSSLPDREANNYKGVGFAREVSLFFAKTIVVSFDLNLSVWTVMGTITFNVKHH
ncbi:hypothetical protein MTR67_026747 [Solanum verrucosum]|uniref:Uncharacterized protein n=1 Tax=Solanum verrucosum TaxID=315347 RepID=A0AAF0R3Q8_SOLVR|nr:hypothetical protein MTR67_026747 [Solanum verrucosum]